MADNTFNVDQLNPGPGLLSANEGFDKTRVSAVKQHLYSDLKDEAVILNMENGKYYGLNAVGVSIWQAIQEPATIEEIEDAVMQEYEVDRETCRNEVVSFIRLMAAEKLIKFADEKSA